MTPKISIPRNIVFLWMVFSIISYSCKKEIHTCKQYTKVSDSDPILLDTVLTNSYLAAYPGSWWTYSNGDQITCEWGIFKGYTLVETNKANCTKKMEYIEIPLPKFSGIYTTDKESAYIKDTYLTKQGENKILYAEQLRFSENQKWNAFQYKRKVVGILPSISLPNGTVFQDVIKISEEHKVQDDSGEVSYFYFLYYANNIGLIWEESRMLVV